MDIIHHDAPLIQDELEIREVRTVSELEAVYRLTHECYVAKDYSEPQHNGLLLHYPEFDVVPETTILAAYQNGEMVGSVSFTVAGQSGFTIDGDFKKDREQLERDGRVIGSIWRLVVKESARQSRQVVIGLFTESTRALLKDGVTTLLSVVNPKHVSAYERMLKMTAIARNDGTDALRNAPAVLMRLDREALPEKWNVADFELKVTTPVGLEMLEYMLTPIFEMKQAS